MSGDANTAGLDALIGKLRRMHDFVVSAAPAAAKAMADELKASASSGTSPDGSAWAPRRKDGAAALAGAAAAITVNAVGTSLVARLGFPYSMHTAGKGHAVARQILPVGAIPARVAAAIKQSLIASWEASQ